MYRGLFRFRRLRLSIGASALVMISGCIDTSLSADLQMFVEDLLRQAIAVRFL